MSTQYYVGTSGWHYDHWRGDFYPDKLPKKDWLDFYTRQFNTVEINNSFYHMPQESTFTTWHKTAPSGFCFAVKVSRFITHIKRLKESREPLHTFIERAVYLRGNLGPLLYQLPASFHRDNERLEAFLILLDKKLRHVFEFRHSSWMDESVYALLRKYNAGFCIFDMPGSISPVIVTSDFAYVRFHGKGDLYSGNYPDSDLVEWARKLEKLEHDLEAIYVYFNNDAGGYAIRNAKTLRKYLGG